LSANDALLLVGHGSARYPDAGNILCRQVDRLRANGLFAQIEMGMLNGSPSVFDALSAIRSPLIRVVPFFMEDGYFNRIAIPRAIGAAIPGNGVVEVPWNPTATALAERAGRQRILLRPPVGTHDGMAGIIEQQALAGCAQLDVASRATAVLVIGHGSSTAPGRVLALHRHTARVASTGLFARVEAACLEEAPFVADTLSMLRAHPVVVIGFFANLGGHVRDDVPALITAERVARGATGRAVLFHGSVAEDPAMTQIILDQALGDPEGK
jgi:sirohydrochlorin cobaltochelatase